MNSQVESEQIPIRCAIVRSGTSKGIFLHECDLPTSGPARDAVLLRIMGSPDVMQIDGLGGTHLITSKIAILGPPSIAGADIDYTFAQAEILRPVVDYSGNCGNISAGVGPFAIDEGFVRAVGDMTEVRIHNTNTGKIMLATVPTRNGRARVDGDFAIDGVPGTGAEIFLDYRMTAGAKTGKVLPTGLAVDTLALENGQQLEVTICDVANTIVCCRAEDIGLVGDELPDAFSSNQPLIELLREIRGKAAQRVGFTSDWRRADDDSPFLPFMVVVSKPSDYVTMNGGRAFKENMDITARLIFMNNCHESMAGTGSMSIATASRIPGSIVNQALGAGSAGRKTLSIGHPLGFMTVRVETRPADNEERIEIEALGFSRTARRIMDGRVYVPRSDLS